MRFDALDLAHLSDVQVKRLVISLYDSATSANLPKSSPWFVIAAGLTAGLRDRRQALLLLEADAMNDGGSGFMITVESDDRLSDIADRVERDLGGGLA